ncbi:MAG: nitroreductase/quinone reductase family protein [Dehalococcoidia bacterium]
MVSRDERHARNQTVIDQLRANGGKHDTMTLLILTTTGAKSGTPFTTPLAYQRDGDRLLVFASNAGGPKHPDWYHNLVANPEVTVEVLGETFQALATTLVGDERDRFYAKQAADSPVFGDYEKRTTRVIPVVALERIS